jgi:hypothetical protein
MADGFGRNRVPFYSEVQNVTPFSVWPVAIVLLLLGLTVQFGMLFWLYWPASLLLTSLARGSMPDRPGGLFLIACVLPFGFHMVFMVASCVPMLGALVILLLGLGGIVGWIVLGVRRARRREEVRAYYAERPLPKLQCWMQDLYVAVFFYALVLAGVTLICNAVNKEAVDYVVPPLAAYVLVATSLGLYIALDVLRRVRPPLAGWGRFGTVAGVIVFCNVSVIVYGLLAWRSWQKALQTAGLEAWRRSAAEKRRAAARAAAAALGGPAQAPPNGPAR